MTCTGFGDYLPSTGLGFPEIIPEDGDVPFSIGQRDDNIEMNQGIILFQLFLFIFKITLTVATFNR